MKTQSNPKLRLVEKLATVTTPKQFQLLKPHLIEYSDMQIVELIAFYRDKNNK